MQGLLPSHSTSSQQLPSFQNTLLTLATCSKIPQGSPWPEDKDQLLSMKFKAIYHLAPNFTAQEFSPDVLQTIQAR
jgi:hypothetical protein